MALPGASPDSRPNLSTPLWLGLIALVGLVGLALRVVNLGNAPPGLHFDQAANGLLAMEILTGREHPVFFPSYTGREALFMYLIAGLSAVLGPGTLALRLAGALSGAATVVALAFLGSSLFNRRVGVAGAAFLAGLYWHLHISRLGERTILVPLLGTLALLALWEAFRRRSIVLAAIGGALVGLQLYTYPSSRFFLLVLGIVVAMEAFGTLSGLKGRSRDVGLKSRETTSRSGASAPVPAPAFQGREGLPMSRPCSWLLSQKTPLVLVVALGAAILAALPLGLHFYHRPEDFLGRADQVAVWNARVAGASPLGAMFHSVRSTLLMFVLRGDADWKYNLAGRPVFDPVTAALFLLGLALVVWHWRNRAARLVVVWWIGMLVPGFLSIDAPQFMRTLGAAPAAALLAALGLEALTRWIRRARIGRLAFLPGLAAVLFWAWPVAAGALATYQYFGVWAPSAAAYLALEGDVTATAGLVEARAPAYAATYVASRYGPNPTISFLAGDQFSRLHWFDGRVVLPLPAPGAGPTLYVLPRTAVDPAWYDRLPAADRIATLTAPDRGPAVEAFVLRPGELEPSKPLAAPVRFGNVARLVGADAPITARAGASIAPTLFWQIDQAPPGETKFWAHLVDGNGETWAQYDEVAYPAAEWRPGQPLIVQHPLDLPDYLPAGSYSLEVGLESLGGQALPAVDVTGKAMGVAWKSAAIAVERPAHPPSLDEVRPRQAIDATFGDSLRLVGATLDQASVLDGDSLRLTLVWEVLRPPSRNLKLSFQVTGPTGAPIAGQLTTPTGGVWPTRDWRAGDVIVDREKLLVPAGSPTGPVSLSVGVLDAKGALLAVDGRVTDRVPLGTISVQARPRAAVTAAIPHRQDTPFQAPLVLLGYDVTPTTARPGDTIHLTLYWQAQQPLDQSWTVFTHLLRTGDKIVAQEDAIPLHGQRPTTTWEPGEIIADPHDLRIDPAAPPGADRLEIGLYDAVNGQRLTLSSGGDRVLLDLPIQVVSRAGG